MIDIEAIENQFRIEANDEGIVLFFKFRDVSGTVRKASINAFAVEALSSMLSDGQRLVIEQMLIGGVTGVGLDLITGPTRGEVYIP